MFELLFQGGMLVDGSGAPGRRADLGVAEGKVIAIGDLTTAEAAERLDISGRVLCPGFIDMHTHSDLPLLVNPAAQSKIRQGVTTEVIGMCGFSPAPLTDASAGQIRQMSTFLAKGSAELDWSWRSFADFLGRLEEQGSVVNVAPVVGHVTMRAATVGFGHRPPSVGELERMRWMVDEAMQVGAFGYSSGLIYPPSCYAETDELVELARVAARHGGIYFSHIRGEGATLMRATAEAIEIGERAGLPVQIAHHKVTGRPFQGRIAQALQLSEWANARGQKVRCDVYPYTAGSSSLGMLIPEWAHEGGRDHLLARLADPETAGRIRADLATRGPVWEDIFVTWVASEDNKLLEGLSLAEIAARRGTDPYVALFQVLMEERTQAAMVMFSVSEDDARRVITHPLSVIGSDGSSLHPSGPLGEGKPHPRNYGTFPRVLQVYVREQGALTLEQAVHKMTGASAGILGLERKGVLREGADADLVVFDPRTVRERGTYADPHQFPEGIDHVIVNGRVVIRQGEYTGVLAGRVLRRGKEA